MYKFILNENSFKKLIQIVFETYYSHIVHNKKKIKAYNFMAFKNMLQYKQLQILNQSKYYFKKR